MQKNLDLFIQDLENKSCIPFSNLSFSIHSTIDPLTLKCELCQGFVLNPVVCKCEVYHLYGRTCLIDFVKTKGFCPSTLEALNQKQISSASFEILEKISHLKIKCDLCKEFQGGFRALKYHLKECGAAIIPCPFYGRFCHEKIMKKDLKRHFDENLLQHLEAAKNAFQIEKLQLLFEVLQEQFKN